MGSVASETIKLVQFLLPGFLAAWAYYGLTSHPRPDQFERTVQALIFTLLTQGLVFIEKYIAVCLGSFWSIGAWSSDSELVSGTVSAVVLGMVFAYFANNDGFHSFMRRIGVSRETSFPSEWFGAFLKNVTFVVLHLKDERRIFGWPIEWPSEPNKGHFVLTSASWLCEEDGKSREVPITGVDSILVSVTDVRWVEFMTKSWESSSESKNT